MNAVKKSDSLPHKTPSDLKKAITSDAVANELWQKITPLAKNEWICWVTSAAKIETREKRIKVGISKMNAGERRPCCWAGCPHRGDATKWAKIINGK